MESLVHKSISDKIKNIPDYLSGELIDFVDYLLFKKEQDWAENISQKEKDSIKIGLEEIRSGKIHSHAAVMEEMGSYIKEKEND